MNWFGWKSGRDESRPVLARGAGSAGVALGDWPRSYEAQVREVSARLELPFLQAGQAGKELWHNEALALIDLAVGTCVEAVGLDAPPAAPAIGQAWIVGEQPTGAWAGRVGAIAGWTGGGWRFVPPAAGMTATVAGTGLVARRLAGAWAVGEVRATRVTVGGVSVVGSRRPAIAAPSGGGTIDAEARATLGTVLAALRAHGLIAS